MSRMGVSIRIATPADAEQIQAIYAPYVEDSAITFETGAPSVAEMQRRIESTLKRFPYLVAERKGSIVGYCYAGTFKSRAAYDWSVETSIYVRRDIRAQGIGRSLYGELERILKLMGITNVNACISYTTTDTPYLTTSSQRFHEKLGYAKVGVFHDCAYKFGRWWDMCWYEKQIGEHKADMPDVTPFSQLRS